MLLDTYELREDAREQFRKMLNDKSAREKVSTRELIAFCTRSTRSPMTQALRSDRTGEGINRHGSKETLRTNNSIHNVSSNSISVGGTPLVAPGESSNPADEKAAQSQLHSGGANTTSKPPSTAASPAVDKRDKDLWFMCWLCGASSFSIYRIRNGVQLCFFCFRLFYLGVILPHLDTKARRESARDLLTRIQLLQESEAAEEAKKESNSSEDAKKASSPLLHATTTQTATGRREPSASALGETSTTTPLEVTEPGQASFVMNASVMLQRRNASRGAASHASSPSMTLRTAMPPTAPAEGGANNDTAAAGKANGDAAESSMLFDTLSERQGRATLPEWERVRPVHSMWSCPRCTFINPEYAKQCEVCNFRNPATVRCPICHTLCSIPSTSAIRGTSRPSTAPRQSLCHNGLPHVVWCCTRCNAMNTTDGAECIACHSPHYWICAYCTERHTTAADVDGLRYCPTCGSYNTPEDLNRGILKLEEESQRAQQAAATTTAKEEVEEGTTGKKEAPTKEAAALTHVQSAPAHSMTAPSSPSPSSLPATAALLAKSQPGFHLDANDTAEVVFGVNDADTIAERLRQEEILHHKERLAGRLRRLGRRPNTRESDGNCLFSALANQLFGRPTLCHTVRAMVVHYMRTHAEDYAVLFTEKEWKRYITQMREPEFWGDELCLNAAARCFHIDIHVITSDVTRWHIVFHHKDLSQSQYHQRAPLPSEGTAHAERHVSTSHNSHTTSTTGQESPVVRALPSTRGSGSAAVQQGRQAATTSTMMGGSGSSSGQKCEVVLPQRGESDAVCVFLAYLYPVHYDDIGDGVEAPLKLPDLFAAEMMRTLNEPVPANSSPTSVAPETTTTTPPAITATQAVKEKSTRRPHRTSVTGGLIDVLFSSAAAATASKPSSASSKRASEEDAMKGKSTHEH